MMSFNIKTVTKISYSNSLKGTETLLQNESLSVTINQTTSKESLEKFKSIFQKWDVELNFSNIEYSSNGKILTAIEVSLKNLKTGKIEVLTRTDSKGIKPFEIFVNKNNKSGFRDITLEEAAHKTSVLQIREIGKNPLYVVNNKEYLSSDLDGKSIKTTTLIETLKPKDARKIYGSKASDGAILVSEGKIIDDFEEELKLIDKENKKESAYFIEVKKNELPVFISLSKNPKSENIKTTSLKGDSLSIYNSYGQFEIRKNVQYYASNTDSISGKGQIRNVKTKNGNRITWISSEKDSIPNKNVIIKKDSLLINSHDSKNVKLNSGHKSNKPLYVVNGVVQEDDDKVLKINPDNIQNVYVLKDESAIRKYGKKGENGVVEINTKDTKNVYQKDIIAFEGNTKNTEMFIISTKSKDYLVVVDGKIKDKSFEIESINPEDIKSVAVLKNKSATEKYGDKGEKGVVEITLKEKN